MKKNDDNKKEKYKINGGVKIVKVEYWPSVENSGNISDIKLLSHKFVQYFHMIYSDEYEVARDHIMNLSEDRKNILKKEMKEFIDENKNNNEEQIRKLWGNMGAERWSRDIEILQGLKNIYDMM